MNTNTITSVREQWQADQARLAPDVAQIVAEKDRACEVRTVHPARLSRLAWALTPLLDGLPIVEVVINNRRTDVTVRDAEAYLTLRDRIDAAGGTHRTQMCGRPEVTFEEQIGGLWARSSWDLDGEHIDVNLAGHYTIAWRYEREGQA